MKITLDTVRAYPYCTIQTQTPARRMPRPMDHVYTDLTATLFRYTVHHQATSLHLPHRICSSHMTILHCKKTTQGNIV